MFGNFSEGLKAPDFLIGQLISYACTDAYGGCLCVGMEMGMELGMKIEIEKKCFPLKQSLVISSASTIAEAQFYQAMLKAPADTCLFRFFLDAIFGGVDT